MTKKARKARRAPKPEGQSRTSQRVTNCQSAPGDATDSALAPNLLQIVDDGTRPIPVVLAESSLSTINLNAISSINAVRPSMAHGDAAVAGINAFAKVMAAKVKAVKDGDMSGPEATLVAQAVTLDCLFTDLIRRAQTSMGAHLGATETYMRLALKAQGQCRATIETLSEMKSPRPVFVRQANYANGSQQINNSDGPQQIVNGAAPPAIPRAENLELPTTELLGGDNVERVG